MKIKPIEALLSITFIGTSLLAIISGSAAFRDYPIPVWVEYIALAVGIAIPVMGLVFRSTPKGREESKMHERDSELYVCLKCEAASQLGESRNGRCPKCGGGMEPLEGFYERNPRP